MERVPPMRRRLVLLLLLLLAAGLAGFWFFAPLPLPSLPEETVQVDIAGSHLRPNGISQETWSLSPRSSQWAQVEACLSGVTCRRCFHTLWGSASMEGTGGQVLSFYGRDRENNILWEMTLTAGSHLRIGGRVYRLGRQDGRALADGLAQILEEA